MFVKGHNLMTVCESPIGRMKASILAVKENNDDSIFCGNHNLFHAWSHINGVAAAVCSSICNPAKDDYEWPKFK